jgi:hypothetical protein
MLSLSKHRTHLIEFRYHFGQEGQRRDITYQGNNVLDLKKYFSNLQVLEKKCETLRQAQDDRQLEPR